MDLTMFRLRWDAICRGTKVHKSRMKSVGLRINSGFVNMMFQTRKQCYSSWTHFWSGLYWACVQGLRTKNMSHFQPHSRLFSGNLKNSTLSLQMPLWPKLWRSRSATSLAASRNTTLSTPIPRTSPMLNIQRTKWSYASGLCPSILSLKRKS